MKLAHIERVKLVEGLDREASRTYRLWESAGHVLKEFQLDAKQIEQLFAQVEKDATAAGTNRTALGKGIDTTTAAGKAVKQAYDDLVDKVQNSGPMQNMDAAYDQAAEKLKQATGGDQGVMKYVQKYRDFATKHPVAQSFIYAALIAAAGISGAGLGGAAVLGLLKMTDQLLQGKKFSTALGKGAMTGATAYAASNILGGGDLPSDPNAPGYQVGAEGPASAPGQFDVSPETSQNFGLTPGGVDPNATQDAIDTAAKTAADAGKEGAKSAASTAATNRAASASDLAADQATGGVTDIDTLKQGIAANSDAAQAATNTDAASAMSSQSDATVNTATDFTSQGAPAGQAASSYAPSADTATGAASDTTSSAANTAGETAKAAGEVTMKSAQEAARAATSRLADAAPGSLGKSAAEQMLQQDLHKAVTDAVTSGKLGNPTDLNFTSRISDFVNEYVAENGKLVKEVSGKQIGGTMQQILRSTGELAGKAAAAGTGSSEFVRGALVREYIDAQSTVRHWALKESLGRPRGGVRLTEAGVNLVFALVEEQALNEGIMDTLKGAAGKVTGAIKGAAGKAGAAIAQTGKNLTNKITADKLKQAWEFEGGNTDSEAIKIFLKQQGVDPAVIDGAMQSVGVKPAADAGVPGGLAPASKGPAAAGGSQFVKDLVAGYMALSAADRAEIMKELDIAIDVSSNSNLVKGMNENKRRKKKAVQ
jgi:hypothetical protein